MWRLRTKNTNRSRRRRGFTLIECIASIAIFAIMGTMFATFMVSSIRVVNVSLAKDRDREMLLEAVAAATSGEYMADFGVVQVEAIGTDGNRLLLDIDLKNSPQVELQDKYVKYTAPNGAIYSIYLGASAMSVKFLVVSNQNDSDELLKAINEQRESKKLKVTYKDEKDYFPFTVDASEASGHTIQIVNDNKGKPYYVKYIKKTGEKYLIYFYKEPKKDETTTP